LDGGGFARLSLAALGQSKVVEMVDDRDVDAGVAARRVLARVVADLEVGCRVASLPHFTGHCIHAFESIEAIETLDWIGLDWIGLDWIGLD